MRGERREVQESRFLDLDCGKEGEKEESGQPRGREESQRQGAERRARGKRAGEGNVRSLRIVLSIKGQSSDTKISSLRRLARQQSM
jgi:hypothetical protein